MKLLAFLGAIAMVATPATTTTAMLTLPTNVSQFKTLDDNRLFKNIVEEERLLRISKKYGTTTPIFTSLKRPNTWENLWYDILLVNGLEDAKFSSRDIQENLNAIRTVHGFNDSDLSNKIGTLISGTAVPIHEEIQTIQVFELVNNGDIVQDYISDSITKEVSTTQEWYLNTSFNFTYSQGLNVSFFGISGSQDIKVSFNINTGVSVSDTQKTTKSTPSQHFILAPRVRTIIDWFIKKTLFLIPGGVQYRVFPFYNQFYDYKIDSNIYLRNDFFEYKDKWLGSNVAEIDFDRTLWLIANKGKEKYFTDDLKDLFVINSEETNLGLAVIHDESGKLIGIEKIEGGLASDYVFNLPLEMRAYGLKVDYTLNTEPLN